MNYGKICTWLNVILCLGSSLGYAVARDWHKSVYFFFAACITLTFVV